MQTDAILLRSFRDEDIVLMKRWLETPHVALWYKYPLHWLREIQERHGSFFFLTHFIAEYKGVSIGFCQYYDRYFAQEHEIWNDGCRSAENQGEEYSIDYFIGEAEYLRRGFGRQMIKQIIEKIWQLGVKKIIVEPEKENAAGNGVLESSGFKRSGDNYIFENPNIPAKGSAEL